MTTQLLTHGDNLEPKVNKEVQLAAQKYILGSEHFKRLCIVSHCSVSRKFSLKTSY